MPNLKVEGLQIRPQLQQEINSSLYFVVEPICQLYSNPVVNSSSDAEDPPHHQPLPARTPPQRPHRPTDRPTSTSPASEASQTRRDMASPGEDGGAGGRGVRRRWPDAGHGAGVERAWGREEGKGGWGGGGGRGARRARPAAMGPPSPLARHRDPRRAPPQVAGYGQARPRRGKPTRTLLLRTPELSVTDPSFLLLAGPARAARFSAVTPRVLLSDNLC
jgi:hypothetical protein